MEDDKLRIEKTLNLSKTVNYGDYKLKNVWEGNDPDNIKNKLEQVFSKRGKTALRYIENADKYLKYFIKNDNKNNVICLLLNELPINILDDISLLAERNRIYMVLPDTVLNDPEQKEYIESLNNILIRYISNPIGNLYLMNPREETGEGMLMLLDNKNKSGNWIYKFKDDKMTEVFHFFIYLFWMKAYEYKDGRAVYSKPADIPNLFSPKHIKYNTEDFHLLNSFMEKASDFNSNVTSELLFSSGLDIKNKTVGKFIEDKSYSNSNQNWCCFIPKDNTLIEKDTLNNLLEDEISVKSPPDNINLFSAYIKVTDDNDKMGWLFLNPFDKVSYEIDLAIKLDYESTEAIINNQDLFGNWVYHKEIKIKAVRNRLRNNQNKKIEIKEKEIEHLRDEKIHSIEKQKEDFKIEAPEEPKPIAKMIEFTKTFHMPILPENVEKDKVYDEWERFKKILIDYRNKIGDIIKYKPEDTKKISDATINELKNKTETEKVIKKLDEYSEKAKQNLSENITKLKAEIQKFEEKNKNKDKNQDNKKIEGKKTEIKELNKQLGSIEKELNKGIPKKNIPEFTLYYDKNKHYIVIRNWEEIERAKELKNSWKDAQIVIKS